MIFYCYIQGGFNFLSRTKYNTKMQQVREWSEGLKSAASSWTYFPLKGTYDRYLLTLREILQVFILCITWINKDILRLIMNNHKNQNWLLKAYKVWLRSLHIVRHCGVVINHFWLRSLHVVRYCGVVINHFFAPCCLSLWSCHKPFFELIIKYIHMYWYTLSYESKC